MPPYLLVVVRPSVTVTTTTTRYEKSPSYIPLVSTLLDFYDQLRFTRLGSTFEPRPPQTKARDLYGIPPIMDAEVVISSRKKMAQVAASIVWCLTCAGVVFGERQFHHLVSRYEVELMSW